jgi:hypothetical protein
LPADSTLGPAQLMDRIAARVRDAAFNHCRRIA